MLKKLDESGSGVAPDIKSFAAKVREELVEPNVTWRPGEVIPGRPIRGSASKQSRLVEAQEAFLRGEGPKPDAGAVIGEVEQMLRGLNKPARGTAAAFEAPTIGEAIRVGRIGSRLDRNIYGYP